jgi:mono/diheme cytochrome c family protein
MTRVAVLLAFVTILAGAGAAQAASVNDGVYSADQAKRGQGQYDAECARCHGPTLGGGGGSPAISGPFWAQWEGRSLGELYHFTKASMPADGPGALSSQAYADIVAYMLSVNHYPAGKAELPADEGALKAIPIVRRP